MILVELRAHGPTPERPRVGQRLRWPGDDREWVWNGEEWIGTRTTFDGGDAWADPDFLKDLEEEEDEEGDEGREAA